MPLPTLVVLPLVLVVRDMGQLLRLPRPLKKSDGETPRKKRLRSRGSRSSDG